MRPIELARKYMAIFYGEAPMESMESLLAEELIFQGPFYEFSSAKDYLNSLRADPPIDVRYKMEETYERENSVCFVYQFSKLGVETRMA